MVGGLEIKLEEGGRQRDGRGGERLEGAVGAGEGAEGGGEVDLGGAGEGGGGECLPSNLAVLLETNQALTTFSERFKLAAKALRSEFIGYSSLAKAASKELFCSGVQGLSPDSEEIVPMDPSFWSCFGTIFFFTKFLLDGLLFPDVLLASLFWTFSTLASI